MTLNRRGLRSQENSEFSNIRSRSVIENSEFSDRRGLRSQENSEFQNTHRERNFGHSIMGYPTVAACIFELCDTDLTGGSSAGELRLQRNTRRVLFGQLGVVRHTFT